MLLFAGFVTICLVVAAGLALYAYRTLDRLERVPINLAAASDEEPKNYLVVGSDSREMIDAGAADADAFLGDGTGGQRADDSPPGASEETRPRRDQYTALSGTDP